MTRQRLSRTGAFLLLLQLTLPGGAQAQERTTERVGDVLMRAMPAVSLLSTAVAGDGRGTSEFLFGAATNALVTGGLKLVIEKPRPDGSDENSFPSGHTSIAFQSAAFLHLRYGLRYGAPAYVAAAFVGFSRVDARKHFWEDVLTGAAIGFVSSLAFTDRRPDDPGSTPLALSLTLTF